MLLVEVAKRHRVDEQLVEVLDAFLAGVFRERDRHLHEMAERLYFVRLLMYYRLRLVQNRIRVERLRCHYVPPETALRSIRHATASADVSTLKMRLRARTFPSCLAAGL